MDLIQSFSEKDRQKTRKTHEKQKDCACRGSYLQKRPGPMGGTPDRTGLLADRAGSSRGLKNIPPDCFSRLCRRPVRIPPFECHAKRKEHPESVLSFWRTGWDSPAGLKTLHRTVFRGFTAALFESCPWNSMPKGKKNTRRVFFPFGGQGGIRTHGTLAGTPDFESYFLWLFCGRYWPVWVDLYAVFFGGNPAFLRDLF